SQRTSQAQSGRGIFDMPRFENGVDIRQGKLERVDHRSLEDADVRPLLRIDNQPHHLRFSVESTPGNPFDLDGRIKERQRFRPAEGVPFFWLDRWEWLINLDLSAGHADIEVQDGRIFMLLNVDSPHLPRDFHQATVYLSRS